jgi:D-alanine-D-alanine ligase
MARLSVGVIFGGRSVEHDVSIITAHQVMDELDSSHEVVPIYITRDGKWLTAPALHDLDVYRNRRWDEVGEAGFIPPDPTYKGFLVPGGRLRGPRRIPLDVVVPAIHGTFGEDGTLQGLIELADLPYTGSGVVGSALGMDKVAMKAAFKAAGLPVVPDALIDVARLDTDADAVVGGVEDVLGYPMFVKPTHLGSSVGIARAADRDSLLAALDVARRYDHRVLVEKAMDDCIEVNCSVLGGPNSPPRVSVCEQPVPWQEFLTFSDKYMRGAKGKSQGMAGLDRRIPAPISDALTKQVQENALAAFKAINAAGVTRVDSFVDVKSEQTWVMEINTTPGSFAFYLWKETGVEFRELCLELIDIALAVHRRKADLLFTFDSGILDAQARGKLGG